VSWNTLSPELRATAEQVLTPRQLDVLKLSTSGMSTRRIALTLDIAESTARGILIRAHQRLNIALRKDAA
jgi:DNA-binding CsgD family transcriptional regulator